MWEGGDRFRAAFAHAAVGMAVTDAEGRYLEVNPAYCRLTGYSQEELRQLDLRSLTFPEDRPISADRLRTMLESPDPNPAFVIEKRYVRKDGGVVWVRKSASLVRDSQGRPHQLITMTEDITERKQAEAVVAEQVRLAEYGREVGQALTQIGSLEQVLGLCAEATVRHLDGAFARIWTTDETREVLELRASAGLYTHTNGPHSRIRVGQDKIGRIAQERKPHLTNTVVGDPRIPAQDWAEREGMVAFAGYPLVVDDRLVGVLAMFARHELSEAALRMMGSVAAEIALGVERSRAEQRLHQHQEWLRVTLASIGDAVIATDTDCRITFLNGVAEDLTGWTMPEAEGKPLAQVFRIINEGTRREVESPASRALQEGAVVGLANHTILIARDGTERSIDDSAAPMRDSQGRLIGAVLIFRDVAEKRRIERALEASEARKASILDTALDAIVTIDQAGLVVDWNPAAEAIFGFLKTDVLGREMGGLIVPPALREAHREGLARYLRTGEGRFLGQRIEVAAVRADGTEFPVELAISPILSEGPAHFTAHIRDISARKSAERRRNARLAVTETLATASTLGEAAPTILKTIGEALGWDVAILWLEDGDSNRLRYFGHWNGPSPNLGRFGAVSSDLTFEPGVGLPGRVWQSGVSVWIPDVMTDDNFPRGSVAASQGLHGAVAVPITLGGRTLGVLEFLGAKVEQPDPDLTEMLSTLSAQIGQSIGRWRAESQRKRLNSIIEHSPDFVGLADSDQNVLYVNRAGQRLMGLQGEDEVRRTSVLDYFPESDRDRVIREILPVLQKTGHWDGEVQFQNMETGQTIPISWNVFTIPDPETGRFSFACVSRDLSDRKQAEEALRRRETQFHTLADSIPQLVWMAEPDGYINWFNRRWYEYTGTTPEQMEGWGWNIVHDPVVLPRVITQWKNSITSGEPLDTVFPLRGADGIFRPFLTRVVPIRDEKGVITQWFGTNTDISERLRVEEELRAAKEEAEAANQAKTQFLAVLSHELRTPLNPILLSASSLLEQPADPHELRPTLEMIRQNVLLQARLIDDLLDVMRIVQGKMPLHWEVVDSHHLIDQAMRICRSEVHGHQLRLEGYLEAKHRHVSVDPARLQQVIWNLIKNAVKFTPEGGLITVRTRNENQPENRLVIEVTDTGIGIEPEILPRIFDPFQQGESTITRKYGGLGLGLAICKGIVDAHDATIEVESGGTGQGTTFRVALKSLPDPPALKEGKPTRASGKPTQAVPANLRILVVEDEPATLRLMARLLKGLGHEVETANAIAPALDALRKDTFNLIVSDIGLPDGSGLELMRQAVALNGPISAIALTGYGMEEDIRRSQEAGFTAHLTKPIDFTKLQAVIRRVTSGDSPES